MIKFYDNPTFISNGYILYLHSTDVSPNIYLHCEILLRESNHVHEQMVKYHKI